MTTLRILTIVTTLLVVLSVPVRPTHADICTACGPHPMAVAHGTL